MFKTCMSITPAPAKFAPLLFAGDWRAGLRAASELGYDAVEVSLRDPDEPAVAGLMNALDEVALGLSAIATGQSYYSDDLALTSSDPAAQEELLRRMKGFVDHAAGYDASIIIGGVRGTLDGPRSQQAAQRQNAISAIRTCAAYAQRRGVQLLIEPINRYETAFLNTVTEVLGFIDDLEVDNCGVLADTFHMNIEEVSIGGALRAAGNRLSYLHLPDSNRLAPGRGHIDFESVAMALEDVGYRGYLGAEILPLPDSRTAAASAADFFQKLWARLAASRSLRA